MMTTVLQDGRREGARRFFVAGDLIVELRQRCTDDDGEMREFYGPQCWHGIDPDLGGLKKTMWLELMKEFNCNAVSSWSSCDDWRREGIHTQIVWENGRKSQK